MTVKCSSNLRCWWFLFISVDSTHLSPVRDFCPECLFSHHHLPSPVNGDEWWTDCWAAFFLFQTIKYFTGTQTQSLSLVVPVVHSDFPCSSLLKTQVGYPEMLSKDKCSKNICKTVENKDQHRICIGFVPKPQKMKKTDIHIIPLSFHYEKMVKGRQKPSIFSQADVTTCLVTYTSENRIS